MSEMLATYQRIAMAVGDEHAADLDLDAHLEEIARVAVRGRAASPSRLPRIELEVIHALNQSETHRAIDGALA